MEVTLDKFGRIVIPKPVRDALGLKAGTKLHLETTERETGEQEIALRPEREQEVFIRKGRGNVRVYAGKLEDRADPIDVAAILRKQYEQRARRHAGLE